MKTRMEIITEYKNTCLRKPLISFYKLELERGNITIDEWIDKITNLYTPPTKP